MRQLLSQNNAARKDPTRRQVKMRQNFWAAAVSTISILKWHQPLHNTSNVWASFLLQFLYIYQGYSPLLLLRRFFRSIHFFKIMLHKKKRGEIKWSAKLQNAASNSEHMSQHFIYGNLREYPKLPQAKHQPHPNSSQKRILSNWEQLKFLMKYHYSIETKLRSPRRLT